ncbi:helix-turn-helix transcriptional regulator [Phenylobacterium montanum]|uniref:LuxR family transcriptional regulator n=1 Tax=Phenylobacterium montanum TaxID=2823693 RepID=A0A975G3Y6_9CAUL|nr:LuxR family transcriptional regulator [Caulobacter sp. S6]QUD90128.1 LuxR family transcriptional regulator [Caulobacter sp. S6]
MVDRISPRLSTAAAAFLAKAATCVAITTLDQDFLDLIRSFGFKTAMCVSLARAGAPVSPTVIFGEESPWIPYYAARNYASLDPTITRAFRTRKAFTWRDVERPDAPNEVRRFFGEAREAWAQDGLIVPIHGPFGEMSVINLLSAVDISLSDDEIAMLQGVCSIYAANGLNLVQGVLPLARTPALGLTPREQQCIFWMSVGKHDADTAEILKISPHTVRAHLDSAKTKFMVETRPELCMKALAHGILVPDHSSPI